METWNFSKKNQCQRVITDSSYIWASSQENLTNFNSPYTGFIQASIIKNSRTIQGLLKASSTVFKDLKVNETY